jgi:tetratricopeptide (TPR) repeat protein
VLLKLQEKKFEYARRVFLAALTRLRAVGAADPNELLILYSYLYTPGMIFGANTTADNSQSPVSKGRGAVTVKSAAEIEPALALEFLRLAADLLLRAPMPSTTADPQATARAQISVADVLMGKLSQDLPEQAVLLQSRVRQMEADAQFVPSTHSSQADGAGRRDGESPQDYAERLVDSLEDQARKETDPLRRDIAYAKAAVATAAEKYERGISLADKIRDDSLSKNLADWLYARASLHFSGADDFDKAYELLRKSDDPLQRAVCLVAGAQKLAGTKGSARAAQWLQEARAIINSAEPDEALTRVALGAVSAYARFDQAQALEVFDDAVKLLNRSPPASAAEEKAPRVERFSGFANADYTRGTEGFGLNAAVGAFGAARFDGVLSSIDKITNAELRGGAIVTLCRKAMQSKPINDAKY